MEVKLTTIAIYSAVGHRDYPEDTWEEECSIANEDELYQFMVDIHKRDARNFNDYPLNGGCSKNGFVFQIEKSILFEGETYYNNNRETVDKPMYFDATYSRYDKLFKRMQATLPNLRKAQAKRQKEAEERKLYEKLKSKFHAK